MRAFLVLEELEPRCVMSLMGNTLFPADNPWNQRIDDAPIAANSSALVNSIGATFSLHPDFGTMWDGGLNGIPYNVVSGSQPKIQVIIDAYADESDIVAVPIPTGAVIEGDPKSSADNQGDRHLIIYDKDNNIAYELFNTRKPHETSDGKWHADSMAVWRMNENHFRPAGWTSADAAGLPILPGLVRPDEVFDQKVITHALRFTVERTRREYVFPGSHYASSSTDITLPRMGERFRLKETFDISGFSPANQVILQALKDYGMIVADNGGPWFLSGEPSSRWNDDDLHALKLLKGSDFEAVDLTPKVTAVASYGIPSTGGVVTITGQNYSGGAGQIQVSFGSAIGTELAVVSDNEIRVMAPPTPGATSVVVTVQTPYGRATTTWVSQSEPPPNPDSTSSFRDTFARADSTTLGNTWTEKSGDLTISAGKLSAVGTSNVAVSTAVSGADVRVEANVTAGAAGTHVGLVARYSGPGEQGMYYGVIRRTATGYQAQIWRNKGGVATRLVNRSVSTGSGQLRFDVIGNSLKLFLNGKVVAKTSDAGIRGPGLTGVIGGAGTTFDNFAVDLQIQLASAMSMEEIEPGSDTPVSSKPQQPRDALFALLGSLPSRLDDGLLTRWTSLPAGQVNQSLEIDNSTSRKKTRKDDGDEVADSTGSRTFELAISVGSFGSDLISMWTGTDHEGSR